MSVPGDQRPREDTPDSAGRGAPRPPWFNPDAIRAKARHDCRARRDAVLKYPDLAKRLTERPLSYERPEQWNGYMPPIDGPYGDPIPWMGGQCATCGNYHGRDVRIARNDSPQRAALIEIVTEAWNREHEAGE